MGYYLLDNPNRNAPQYAYPRRGGRKPSGTIIVHTAEGNGRAGVQRFIANRSDYGSYHRLSDETGTTKLLPFDYEAWQDTETNGWGIGISAACCAADWKRMAPAKADAILRNLARAAAEAVEYMRATHGVNVPIRRISGAQARAGVPGFCAHGDSGHHRSDPGKDFDWDLFFTYINQELGGIYAAGLGADIMATLDKEDYANIAHAVWAYDQQGKTQQAWHFQKNLATVIWGYKGKGQKRDAYWHLLNVGTNLLNTKIKNGKGVAYRWISYIVNDNQNAWDTKRLVEELAKKSGVDVAQIESAMSNVLQAEMPELLAENAVDVEVTINPKEKI